MLENALKNLTEEEKTLVFDSIPYITILIAGSEGLIEDKELSESKKITQIRTYTFHDDMGKFYKKVGENYNERLYEIINQTPRSTEERNAIISDKLAQLSDILPKMDMDFADLFYSSIKSFARHVARSAGGFLNFGSISYQESKLIDLPMIKYDYKGI